MGFVQLNTSLSVDARGVSDLEENFTALSKREVQMNLKKKKKKKKKTIKKTKKKKRENNNNPETC